MQLDAILAILPLRMTLEPPPRSTRRSTGFLAMCTGHSRRRTDPMFGCSRSTWSRLFISLSNTYFQVIETSSPIEFPWGTAEGRCRYVIRLAGGGGQAGFAQVFEGTVDYDLQFLGVFHFPALGQN